ncbi:PREDICTED: uncharacterized protein LOC105451569 isoform X1 [Wasmannia auropunctata]|uniref:uncharacterized protein LOC105451569 isoform X1 n=1 Tax=Wasmannia auropunctata TaxID=64793 RepID=UPI0005EDE58E|nr:PREDICTED: uncharacterized protein LOC105451569 isoform X1 [Wasmannia auropunctata]
MPPMGRLKVKVNPAAIWSPVAALSRKLTTHLTSLYAIVFFTRFLLSRRTPAEALCRKKLMYAYKKSLTAIKLYLTKEREMKLTSILFRNARQPQNENKVPFKAILPLKLRDFVSSKGQKNAETQGCLHEMTLLLRCLEENDPENKRCIPQLNALNQCYKTYGDSTKHGGVRKRASVKEQSVPVPNSKNLTHKQITHLLRRYPTV